MFTSRSQNIFFCRICIWHKQAGTWSRKKNQTQFPPTLHWNITIQLFKYWNRVELLRSPAVRLPVPPPPLFLGLPLVPLFITAAFSTLDSLPPSLVLFPSWTWHCAMVEEALCPCANWLRDWDFRGLEQRGEVKDRKGKRRYYNRRSEEEPERDGKRGKMD